MLRRIIARRKSLISAAVSELEKQFALAERTGSTSQFTVTVRSYRTIECANPATGQRGFLLNPRRIGWMEFDLITLAIYQRLSQLRVQCNVTSMPNRSASFQPETETA